MEKIDKRWRMVLDTVFSYFNPRKPAVKSNTILTSA